MSDKMTCPACDSYTSSVRMAFESGNDCPHCGLSADAAIQIEQAAKRGADADLIARVAVVEREAADLRKRLRVAEWRLQKAQDALTDQPDEWVTE